MKAAYHIRRLLLPAPVLQISLSLVLLCSLADEAQAQKGKPSGGNDSAPPAAITDLTLGEITDNSIPLTWTATGDDGTNGTASSYQFRYLDLAQTGLTPPDGTSDFHRYCHDVMLAHWDAATQVALDPPKPQPSGNEETYRIKLLAANTPYCTAIVVLDDAGKASEISNGVHAETMKSLASDWEVVLVDAGPWVSSADGVSLAYGSSGYPSIAYDEHSSSELRFAQWSGSAWEMEVLDVGNVADITPSLAYAPEGELAVAFIRSTRGGAGDLIYVHRNTNGSWSRELVASRRARNPSLVFQTTGEPAICFYMHNDGILFARRRSTGTWTVETIDPDGQGRCELAFDPSDNPGVTYRKERAYLTFDLVFARLEPAGGWQTTLVAHDVNFDHGLIHDGTSFLAAYSLRSDTYAQRYVRVAKVDGTLGVEYLPNVTTTGYGASIALPSDGGPVVTYGDYAYLYAATWTGSTWSTQIVEYAPRTTHGGSVATDPIGQAAAVAYTFRTSSGDYHLKLAHPTTSYLGYVAKAVPLSSEKTAERITLSTAYPNPFNPTTSFTLSVDRTQHVRVEIFDLLGRRVALLHDGLLQAGPEHRFTFDAHHLPSGTYLYRATGASFSDTRPVVLVK